MLKAKLSLRFYIVALLLFSAVILVWYGIYFLNANEILMENGTPMDSSLKSIFTFLMSVVALSWSISLVTVIRQVILGSAFSIDENGIQNTATAMMFLAFIFVIPVKRIPYNAVQQVDEEDGILTIRIDKSKIHVLPFLRPLVQKEYHFFSGFTTEKTTSIKEAIINFIKI